nr:hypothetical protein [Tanacetum cinerariifolium]
VIEIPFAAHHAEGVFGFGIGPVLAVVVIGTRRMGNACQPGPQLHRVAQVIDALFLVQVFADATVSADVLSVAAGRTILGALGLKVHGAAQAAAGGAGAVDECVRAFEDLNALDGID